MTFEQAWDALHAELEQWPGWHLTDLHAGSSTGSHHDGEWGEGKSYYETHTGSWCAVAIEDGWAEGAPASTYRPRFLHWGDSPADALDGLRGLLQERRENPHLAHIYDHLFLPECADCVNDWSNAGNGALTREESYA